MEHYGPLYRGITGHHTIGPLLAVLGTVASTALAVGSTVAAPLVAGAGALGSAALSTAGAIGSTALAGAGVLGKAIPAVIGGIGPVAKAITPVAELFGAGYGVYQSMEQLKMQKRALAIAEKQYPTSGQMSQEELAMRGLIPPIQTLPALAKSFQPEDQAEAKRRFYMPPEEPGPDLWTYAPIALIGLLLWKVVK